MNILTDILSLIKRGVFVKTASPDDVIVLGVNEQPDMTGVASPIPYKSVKLIKVKDLKIAPAFCDNENTPTIPASGTGQVFKEQIIDPITNVCTNYFRSLKSLSTNLIINESVDNDYIELTTTGEPNLASNLGTGTGLYASKTGETLNFKSLIGTGVSISQSGTEVTLNHASKVILTAPDGSLWEITISNTGGIETTLLG
jgi:hypothetical protein